MTNTHIHRTYESELTKLREQLLVMGAKAEELVARAVAALASRDAPAARRVMELDDAIDRMEVEIDELALGILARRQPVASDLRFIAAALKMVTDLERVADLGVNIAERAIELSREPELPMAAPLSELAAEVTSMLHDALDAFMRRDTALARDVQARDRAVDARFASIFQGLVATMTAEPRRIECATRMQSVARYLERIADHGTNIAERVVFIVAGRDVRHAGEAG
jgi:phosphate transport system protein